MLNINLNYCTLNIGLNQCSFKLIWDCSLRIVYYASTVQSTHTLWPMQATCVVQALVQTCHKAHPHQCFWQRADAISFFGSAMLEHANGKPLLLFWAILGGGRCFCGRASLGREWSLDVAIRPHPNPCCTWPQFGPCGMFGFASAIQQKQIQAAPQE